MASGTTTPPINITEVVQRNLVAMPVPPFILLRIVPGSKWATYMWPQWLKHIASRKVGGTVTAPMLGLKIVPHIHTTDEESLDGYLNPGDIASRLGLQLKAHVDCNKYGLVIIRLTITDPTVAILPPPTPLAPRQGFTSGNAREWLIPNLCLDATMDVMYIGYSHHAKPF